MSAQQVLADHRRAVMAYWERGRLIYLGVLLGATVIGWLHARTLTNEAFGLQLFSVFHVAALVACFFAANACYCAVYLVEFILMGTRLQAFFHQYRWVLRAGGCVFGAALAYALAFELFRPWGL